jgi:flagellar protein FlgJ
MAIEPRGPLAVDARSIDALRHAAARDPRAAVNAAATQFEALFMQELLKSMRASTMPSGLVDADAGGLGTEMLDAEYARTLSGRPGGLADVIARQLSRQLGLDDGAAGAAGAGAARLPAPQSPAVHPSPPAARASAVAAVPAGDAGERRLPRIAHGGGAGGFIAAHRHAARAAEAATGIPADFMLAQAALETGWGRRDIRMADGSPSHNVFGIKAGANWKGPVAEITTTEYVGGQPRRVTARFRAYASSDDAFADYARLMTRNPRYAPVLAQAKSAHGFAQALQRAGYATDPAYADKLARVIDTTLRLQRNLG